MKLFCCVILLANPLAMSPIHRGSVAFFKPNIDFRPVMSPNPSSIFPENNSPKPFILLSGLMAPNTPPTILVGTEAIVGKHIKLLRTLMAFFSASNCLGATQQRFTSVTWSVGDSTACPQVTPTIGGFSPGIFLRISSIGLLKLPPPP